MLKHILHFFLRYLGFGHQPWACGLVFVVPDLAWILDRNSFRLNLLGRRWWSPELKSAVIVDHRWWNSSWRRVWAHSCTDLGFNVRHDYWSQFYSDFRPEDLVGGKLFNRNPIFSNPKWKFPRNWLQLRWRRDRNLHSLGFLLSAIILGSDKWVRYLKFQIKHWLLSNSPQQFNHIFTVNYHDWWSYH